MKFCFSVVEKKTADSIMFYPASLEDLQLTTFSSQHLPRVGSSMNLVFVFSFAKSLFLWLLHCFWVVYGSTLLFDTMHSLTNLKVTNNIRLDELMMRGIEFKGSNYHTNKMSKIASCGPGVLCKWLNLYKFWTNNEATDWLHNSKANAFSLTIV